MNSTQKKATSKHSKRLQPGYFGKWSAVFLARNTAQTGAKLKRGRGKRLRCKLRI